MQIPRIFHASPLLAVALLTTAGAAHADVRSDMALNAAAGSPASISFSTSIQGSTERQTMNVTSPVTYNIVGLMDCAKHTYVEMDPALKIYATMPGSEAPPDQLGLPNFQLLFNKAGRDRSLKTGTLTMAVTVKDLGTDTAPGLGRRAHHYIIASHRASTGAAGSDDTTANTDVWMDPILKRPACPDRTQNPRTWTTPSGAVVTSQITGDVDAYKALESDLPLEIQIHAGDTNLTFKQTSVSTDALSPSLFTVPKGYQQKSLSDFAQAEENAILDQIAGPQPKLPKN